MMSDGLGSEAEVRAAVCEGGRVLYALGLARLDVYKRQAY